MEIIFDSPDFVVVDKESGQLSIPGRLNELDTRVCLLTELEKKFGQKIFVVHRLDCEVSGLIMYAKNAKTHRELNDLFQNHQITKKYEALTQIDESVSYDKDNKNAKKIFFSNMLVKGKKRAFEAPYGKLAETSATLEVITLKNVEDKIGLWKLQPKSGRFHQLRFQLYNYGCPILNDSLYNSTFKAKEGGGIALRSVSLEFDNYKFTSNKGILEYYRKFCEN